MNAVSVFILYAFHVHHTIRRRGLECFHKVVYGYYLCSENSTLSGFYRLSFLTLSLYILIIILVNIYSVVLCVYYWTVASYTILPPCCESYSTTEYDTESRFHIKSSLCDGKFHNRLDVIFQSIVK